METVRITHELPPIPTRACNWRAGFDGREEEGRDGFGETPIAAILDLYQTTETPEEVLACVVALIRADADTLPAEWAEAHSGMIRAANLVEGIE